MRNPKFLEPGAEPGAALDWVRTVEAVAVFGGFTSPGFSEVSAAEIFQWAGALLRAGAFTLSAFDSRTPNPRDVEDFEDLWGARHARLLSRKQAPFVLQPGETLIVRVNGVEGTATFQERDFANIADARAEEVARVIDRALSGADAFMAPGGREVVIATTAAGVSTTLEVTGGTAAAKFDFPTSAQGSDEEGGAFFRRAEYDLMNFVPQGKEFDGFEFGYPADGSAPVLWQDPHDKLARFTIVPADPFLPAAFIAALNTYTFTALGAEVFEAAGYPGESLTINFQTGA